MKLYCLVAIVFLRAVSAYSQTIDATLPTIAPLSPEAAGIGKFGDVPTTEYTGTPAINIPLYTLKTGDLELPISLSYHATGIQTTQEASWVGLGWNLIAGGAISVVPVGANDQNTAVFNRPWSEWSTFFSMYPYPFKTHEQYAVGWGCNTEVSGNKTPDMLVRAMVAGEGEPDSYVVNFLDYSFKFVYHPGTGKPYFLSGKNKCKIEKVGNITNWIITGEDGVKYYFNETETSPNNTYVSTWLLTGILTQEGHSIQFRYANYGTLETLPSLVENYYYNGSGSQQISTGGCSSPSPARTGADRQLYQDNTYRINNKYLAEIESDNEIVKLYHSPRIDMQGASRKLDSMVVFNKLTNKRIRKNVFSFSYFEGVNTGSDYLAQNDVWQTWYGNTYPESVRKYRLKLDSLFEYGSNNEKNTFFFKYDTHTPLPYKTTFARDFWGFYNGQKNETSFTGKPNTTIPKTWQVMLHNLDQYLSLPALIADVDGATRLASKDYITAGMLTEINYPTGGRTVFEYEPHSFTGMYKFPMVEDLSTYVTNFSNSAVAFNSPSQIAGFGFTVKAGAFVDISAVIKGSGPNGNYTASQLSPAFVKVIGSGTAGNFEKTYQLTTADYSEFNSTLIKQWRETVFLSPGSYSLYCSFPTSLGAQPSGGPQSSGTIHFTDFNKAAIDTMESYGGGVRLKKLTNYANAGTIASIKAFSYNNTDNKSSGRQMSIIKLFKEYDQSTADGQITTATNGSTIYTYCRSLFHTYKLYGASYASLASTPNGNYVGYDRVEVYNIDLNNNKNGKEVKYFENIPATLYFSEIPVFDNFMKNGSIKQNIYLQNNGDTVLNEEYKYVPLDIANERFNARGEDTYEGPSNYCVELANPLMYNTRFWLYAYNSYSSWVMPQSKTVTSYSDGNRLKTIEEYKYDTASYQPVEIKTTLSDGRTKYTRFKYPTDLISDPSTFYKQMVDRNMFNKLIVKTVTIAGSDGVEKPIESLKNYYDLFGSQLFLAKVQTSKSTYDLEDKIVFHNKDAFDNILEQSKKNDVHTSYIWDYNKSYPIAEAVNAPYDQIAYTSFESTGTGNWTLSGNILTSGGLTGIRAFNGKLSKSANTAVSYTVTLWCYANTSATVNGTTGVEITTRGNWKLLSWKIPAGNTMIEVQGTNIDEVRMYPSTAYMTTYVYEPSVGVTQKSDPDNRITSYEYDAFGRLKTARDHDNNIIKTLDYRYQAPLTQ
jgi:YD repeat-containing protein